MTVLRVALAQINPVVGDMAGNSAKIADYIGRAKALEADLIAFPEMAITGYPPEDLLLKPSFIADNLRHLHDLAAATREITAIVGFVDRDRDIYNAAAVLHDGKLSGVHHKNYLPNYSVFDEDRYFRPGATCPVFIISGVPVGVNICEDIWYPGPIARQASAGAKVIITINASPYHHGRREPREHMVGTRAFDNGVFVCYVNTVGGQDELVFDGSTVVFNPKGEVIARAHQFQEELLLADLPLDDVFRQRLRDPRHRKSHDAATGVSEASPVVTVSAALPPRERPSIKTLVAPPLEPLAEVYQALVTGTRDYVSKNHFKKVTIGLSGGIDSTMVTTIACDALGSQNVAPVSMPSMFSSESSVTDAAMLARNLGLQLLTVPIKPTYDAYMGMLAPSFKGLAFDVTEENIQARIRGNILMALSNKFGWLVLSTGDKSELAVGFATLYGDMAGGYAVIKDVFKTTLYRLAHYRNGLAGRALIPESVLTKPPSPELRPDQLATDTLPPYEMLDPILQAYVEEDKSLDDIVALGFDEALVRRVISMVDRAEYKRRQAAPGVRITPKAFGKDRRLPITNGYRH